MGERGEGGAGSGDQNAVAPDVSACGSSVSALQNAISAAIVTIDTDGVVRYANRGMERMFGFPADAIVGRNVTLLMGGPDAQEHDSHIGRYLSSGHASIIGIGRNVRGRKADGSTFPIHLAVEEIETSGFRGYLGIMTDQSALELSEPRVLAAVDGLSEGFALYDESQRLVLSNERYRTILGLAAEAVRPGTMFDDHVSGAGVRTGPLARGALRDAQPGHLMKRYTLAGERLVAARLTRLRSGDAMLGLHDETEEAARAAALSRAERLRALGELTGGVAHDFNNLLAVVIGNLELLSSRLSDAPGKAMVREALEAAEIGARLTDRLLAFARRQPLVAERIDINALIGETAQILERTLGANIALAFSLADALPPVLADRGALESGLINLATNARDAMPQGGTLTIATAEELIDEHDLPDVPAGSFVRLSVTDTGSGMSPDVAARVFEPFFTTKEKGRGSGLGLSSLYGFAKQSGGSVTVVSEPSRGSRFDLYLPTAESRARTVAQDAKPEAPLEGKVVLVVDDDARVRRLGVHNVAALGARVLEASGAQEALELAGLADRLDALFCDVVMPGGLDGFALAARLREERPDLPVLFTTGFSDRASPVGASGARDVVLRKPFRRRDLEVALLRVMGIDRVALPLDA